MILIMIGGAAGVMQQQSSLAICIITKSNGFCYGIFCRNTISLMEDLSVTQQKKNKYIYIQYIYLQKAAIQNDLVFHCPANLKWICNGCKENM